MVILVLTRSCFNKTDEKGHVGPVVYFSFNVKFITEASSLISFLRRTDTPTEVDFVKYASLNVSKARDEVLNLMIETNLIDAWRELNLEKKQLTWRRKSTNQKARLDFFFISELLFTSVVESEILPGYKTEHSLILLKLEFGKFQKGRSY